MIKGEKDDGEKRERIKIPDFTQVPEDEYRVLSAHEAVWIIIVIILLVVCVTQYIKFLPE